MGGRDIDEFLQRMKNDPTFRDRVLESDDPETRLAVARAQGYAVTVPELDEHAARLGDDELEGIAAAGCPTLCDKRIEPS